MALNSKEDIIDYELELANEKYIVGGLTLERGFWRSAVGNFYYACYHGIRALFVEHDLGSKTHRGAHQLFYQHFIASSLFHPERGVLLQQLFTYRQATEYSVLVALDANETASFAKEVEEFLLEIKLFLKD